jgi:hypothetical protein
LLSLLLAAPYGDAVVLRSHGSGDSLEDEGEGGGSAYCFEDRGEILRHRGEFFQTLSSSSSSRVALMVMATTMMIPMGVPKVLPTVASGKSKGDSTLAKFAARAESRIH